MDPLSITVSVIALIGASIKVSETVLSLIREIRNAPDGVLWLGNEISDFRAVLLNIQEGATQEQLLLNSVGPTPDVQSQSAPIEAEVWTQRAQSMLLEMETLFKKARNVSGIIAQNCIWIREKSRLKQLREELRDIKLNLSLYFCVRSR